MEKIVVCATYLVETSPQSLPLGAACIASAIKNCKNLQNFKVSLIFQSLEEKNNSLLEKLFSFEKIDYLILSVFVWNRFQLEDVAFKIKQKFPDCVVISGGPEVTANPFTFKNFDFLVCGAGEEAICNLLLNLEKNDFQKINGVYKNGEKAVFPVVRAKSPDILKISSPYLDGTLDPGPFGGALWELARGCPFKCSYCYESKGEKSIQYFPLERIEKELEIFNQKKISQVFVLDPTYNVNKKRSIDLINLILKKAPGIFFYFEVRAEFIDRELARAFTKIPCALQIGLQSANENVLKNVNRTFDEKKFKKNVGILNEEGVIFGFDLIYGLPGDTFEGFKKSIDFAINLYPNNLELFVLSVLPGTTLFEDSAKFNLEFQKDSPYNVIKTPTFSQKEIASSSVLSAACNIFYNQGRAVPWFNSVCEVLHKRPSVFFEDFAFWFEKNSSQKIIDFSKECENHFQIEKLQLKFLKEIFEQKKKNAFFDVCADVVRFYGALARTQYDKTTEILDFKYSVNDLQTMYALDFRFFYENFKKSSCKAKFKNGDFTILKR